MQPTAIEFDNAGFDDLKAQILSGKAKTVNAPQDIREEAPVEEAKAAPDVKKYVFTKGESRFELDEDAEFEFVADKKPQKLTLRELKDRAAGDIAVKNRMHALAEEKKKVQTTFKEFADLAKNDPLGALEFIASRAQEADSEFEYTKYIEKLAEQAEKIGQMDEKDRKAWELEKKLQKAEQDLSHKERVETVVLRKQEILSTFPEIGDHEFGQMVDAVLSNEELMEGLETETEIMDKVEELVEETVRQRDIISLIEEINPAHVRDSNLVFLISDQIRQNPDLANEEDVRDILMELIGKKEDPKPKTKEDHIRILSEKARQAAPESSIRTQGASDFDLLAQQLMEKKKDFQKTPVYMR